MFNIYKTVENIETIGLFDELIYISVVIAISWCKYSNMMKLVLYLRKKTSTDKLTQRYYRIQEENTINTTFVRASIFRLRILNLSTITTRIYL